VESSVPTKRERLSDKQESIQKRRESVYRYLLRGLNQQEIANALSVSQATISSDVQFIESEAVRTLPSIVETGLAFQFQKCYRIVEEVGRECWIIFHGAKDDHLKLKALREIRESSVRAFDLLQNGQGLLRVRNVNKELAQLHEETEEWKRSYSGAEQNDALPAVPDHGG
jgi:hypothetical protein